MSSILKTGALIKTIKRRAMLPKSQETFLEDDFLEMATEEVNLGLVPLIQKMHEEHLVYFQDIPLDVTIRKYPIPARAHGNKLRDIFLVDQNGNLFEMARYSLGEIAEFSSTTSYINNRGFYLENNNIVLTNFEVNQNFSLRVYFYMRPNKLVVESRGLVSTVLTSTVEQDYLNPKAGSITAISIADAAVITAPAHGLTSGDKVLITSSDSTPIVDGLHEVAIIDSNSFSVAVTTTVGGTTGAWIKYIDVIQVSDTAIPDIFATTTIYDIVQNISPNKIVHYDITANYINQTTKTISFRASDVPELVAGSFITPAEETIVPNIPTELHPILAQRVAIACLEAMGDEQNKQSAERKLKQMEDNSMTFLDNRVEGAQVKIKSKSSTLNSTLDQYSRRNRRW
jgi:hypothetical protein